MKAIIVLMFIVTAALAEIVKEDVETINDINGYPSLVVYTVRDIQTGARFVIAMPYLTPVNFGTDGKLVSTRSICIALIPTVEGSEIQPTIEERSTIKIERRDVAKVKEVENTHGR